MFLIIKRGKEKEEAECIRITGWAGHVEFQVVNETTLTPQALRSLSALRHRRALSRIQWLVKLPIETIRSDFIVTPFLKMPHPATIRCGTYIHLSYANEVRILVQEANINPNHPHLCRKPHYTIMNSFSKKKFYH